MPFKAGLYFETVGVGHPIIFIHGMGLDSHSMKSFYEPLLTQSEQDSLCRIYLDLPGMGASEIPHTLYNADNLVEQINSFSHAISSEQVGLVSHSYGGYLALGLLSQFQKSFVAGFLTAPVVIANHATRHVAPHKLIIKEKLTDNSDAFADYLAMNVVIDSRSCHQYQKLILPAAQNFNQPFWDTMKTKGTYRLNKETSMASLVKQPVTMLLGQNDNEVGYMDQLAFAEGHANIHAQVLQNAGHNLMIDAPTTVATQFHTFLNSLFINLD